MSDFKYLGRVLTASDDNWPVVVGNLGKSRKQWARIPKDFRVEESRPHTSGKFHKAVVQTTLMLGAETWVMSHRIVRTLGGFHHRVTCLLGKIQTSRDLTYRWIYPRLGTAMKSVGL